MKDFDPCKLEREFHDRKATIGFRKDHYAWGILDKADKYAYDLLGDLQDKVILDLGCGVGHHAIRFAQRGAIVYAIDLSAKMVEKAKSIAKENSLDDRVKILQMDAEELQFADETFDLVFGRSILHHTRLELTRTQVHRVLKQGGKGIFLEPLGHNPFINLFRKLTPQRRTPTERPLKIEDVIFFSELFSVLRYQEFYYWLWLLWLCFHLKAGALLREYSIGSRE